MNEELTKAGFEVVDDGFRTTWAPDEDVLAKLREFGSAFVGKL